MYIKYKLYISVNKCKYCQKCFTLDLGSKSQWSSNKCYFISRPQLKPQAMFHICTVSSL